MLKMFYTQQHQIFSQNLVCMYVLPCVYVEVKGSYQDVLLFNDLFIF